MQPQNIRQILNQVRNNKLSVHKAFEALKELPYSNIDFARVDHHRYLRKGFPEAVFCQGKTPEQVTSIFLEILKHSPCALASRANREQFDYVAKNR